MSAHSLTTFCPMSHHSVMLHLSMFTDLERCHWWCECFIFITVILMWIQWETPAWLSSGLHNWAFPQYEGKCGTHRARTTSGRISSSRSLCRPCSRRLAWGGRSPVWRRSIVLCDPFFPRLGCGAAKSARPVGAAQPFRRLLLTSSPLRRWRTRRWNCR